MVDPIADNTDMQDALRLGGDNFNAEVEVDTGPLYRVVGNSRIPVSKATGILWQSRIEQSAASRTDIEQCWTEALRYYENDQLSHRNDNGSNGDRSSGSRYSRLLGKDWTETENVVFSNAVTMLPLLYAKNPAIEVTATNDANEAFANCAEKLVNALLNMREVPGLHIKSKARRAVLLTYLTNRSYLKIGWTDKEQSSETAIEELQKLSNALENAKNQNEIREIEGKIQALEQKVDLLTPAGPTVKMLSGFRVYIDPACNEPDLSDANWIAEYDYLPTDYVNAVYGKTKDGKTVSVYEPSHVLRAGSDRQGIEDEVNNFTLIAPDKEREAKNYGYKDNYTFKSACYTKVWYVWDKTTRRVMLFADNNWKWPLWVWDDPLKLMRFFPYFPLWFHETPDGSQPKGEVTYYLDQQDAINDINSEINRARKWVKRNIFYNKNGIKQEDVEQVLKGPDGTARGVDLPEGGKLSDYIFSFQPPALAYPELFATASKFETINRITGLSDAQRGAQFKTNTTNEAINFYQKNVDIRVDEKIDAIEDWLGDFCWSLLQLLAQKWDAQMVASIIGDQHAQAWMQINDPAQLRTQLNLRVIGGSTDKPTSQVKKQMALETGQVLGQFANQVPMAGVVALKVLQRAFNEVVITDAEWDMIFETMQQQMQGEQGQPQQGGGDEQQRIQELISQLPPEGQQALQELVDAGMPPAQALEQVVQATSAQQPIQ